MMWLLVDDGAINLEKIISITVDNDKVVIAVDGLNCLLYLSKEKWENKRTTSNLSEVDVFLFGEDPDANPMLEKQSLRRNGI